VSLLISIIGIFISGYIGVLTVWLAVRKRLEEETLGKAKRKTAAMQLLSHEESTLEQVRDECIAIGTLLEVGSFGQHRDHLLGETKRVAVDRHGVWDSAACDLGRTVPKNCYNAGMDFEWNESKAAVKMEKHGVSFKEV
jgi:hypothetical protein